MSRRKSARRPKVKKAPKGQLMFGFSERNEDLPLFSGTPMKVKEMPFIPEAAARQRSLFGRPTVDELREQLGK